MPAGFCWKSARFLLAAFLCLIFTHDSPSQFAGNAFASDISSPPPRAQEAVAALQSAAWQELEEGLSLHQASTALGTRLTTLRISPEHFKFSVEQQAEKSGERVSSVLKRTGGTIAVNGGFFGQKASGALFPVGELIDEGASVSHPWSDMGGYLAMGHDGKLDITLSRDGTPMWAKEAVQSKPVLIEAGGNWAMNTNGTEPERRSAVCILPDGDVLLMIVSGGGLTLYEAGWVMRGPKWGGFYDCDRAIALDGGGSTQLMIEGQSQLDITGLTPVQNVLVVHRRAAN